MPEQLIERAAYNNAVWCDAVCRAAGSPGRFEPGIWLTTSKAPPFYPNAVTLSAGEVSSQLDAIRGLLKSGIPGAWAVKDSFCTLDLAPLGFRVLFEAQWMIWRPERTVDVDVEEISGVNWDRMSDAQALAEWESAWRSDPSNRTESRDAIFGPSLMDDPDIAFIAACRDREIIAGAIANRADGIIGLSNVFIPPGDEAKWREACLRKVTLAFRGLPAVGYESTEDFPAWQALGFEELGRLRVWVTAG